MHDFFGQLQGAIPHLRLLFGAIATMPGFPEPVQVASKVLQHCGPFIDALHGPHMELFGTLKEVDFVLFSYNLFDHSYCYYL